MMQKIWLDTFVSQKDFVIVVGENKLGRVEFNLKEYPHTLIEGEVGSGKSVMLRCLLWQCIKKGAQVYMIDFYGDMAALRKSGIAALNDYQDVFNLLKKLNQEMQRRLQLFEQSGVKNLTEYNHMVANAPLARIVLACDGVFDILTMMDNDPDKMIFRKIKSEIFTLVNISHDLGIHAFITTCEAYEDTVNLPIMITTHKTGECDYFAKTDSGRFWAYIFKDTDLEMDSDKWENSNMQQDPEGKEDGCPVKKDETIEPVNLYPEMNQKVASLLEISNEPIDLYAATYIRHLEAKLKKIEKKARDGNDATEQD